VQRAPGIPHALFRGWRFVHSSGASRRGIADSHLDVIARSEATKQCSLFRSQTSWIASRSLSSGARSRDPLARNDVQCLGCLKIESEIVPSMITRSSDTQTILLIILKANFVWSNHDRAFHGHMVRDARRCRAPHHEGLRPHPEEARSAVSKDEATELENALSRDRHRDRFCNKKFSAVEANTCMLASRSALPVSRVIAECSRPATAMQLWPAASP